MIPAFRERGYQLTTAEILYHLPDFPGILQTYVWQEFDLAPRFPVLHQFLDFWSRELDGTLHSVRVTAADARKPNVVRAPGAILTLH
jgi:uncharacterized protein Usg